LDKNILDLAVFQPKMSVVSRILAVFLTYRDNAAKPNISPKFLSSHPEFKKKHRLGVYIQVSYTVKNGPFLAQPVFRHTWSLYVAKYNPRSNAAEFAENAVIQECDKRPF